MPMPPTSENEDHFQNKGQTGQTAHNDGLALVQNDLKMGVPRYVTRWPQGSKLRNIQRRTKMIET